MFTLGFALGAAAGGAAVYFYPVIKAWFTKQTSDAKTAVADEVKKVADMPTVREHS